MATKQMTYAELGAAWGITAEAARKRVEGMRLPRQPGNDGRTRVLVDVEAISVRPPQPPSDRSAIPSGRRVAGDRTGDRSEVGLLQQHVGTLRAEVERLAALATTNRTDFERERERAERATADLTALAERLADAERERAVQLVDAEQARGEAARAQAEAEALRHALKASEEHRGASDMQLHAFRAMPWWRRAFG